MNILLLKGYNNYFNRILKTETSLDNYKAASTSYLEYADINFVYNDGVATELVVGGPTQDNNGSSILSWDSDGSPDYLIAWEYVDNVATIRSRWFVMESVKTRKGQYRIALKRDVLADEKDIVMNSPCYVEKGTITSSNDPLLFTPENNVYNQIKVNETPIRDETGCAWLVGYLKKNITATDLQEIGTVNYTNKEKLNNIIDANDLDYLSCINFYNADGTVKQSATKKAVVANKNSSKFYLMVNTTLGTQAEIWGGSQARIRLGWNLYGTGRSCINDVGRNTWKGMSSGAFDFRFNGWDSTFAANFIFYSDTRKYMDSVLLSYLNANKAEFNNLITLTKADLSSYKFLDSTIRDKTLRILYQDKIYRLSVSSQVENITKKLNYSSPGLVNYLNKFDGNQCIVETEYVANDTGILKVNTTNKNNMRAVFEFNCEAYTLEAIEETEDETLSYTLPASTQRYTCKDALYDMFIVPVDPIVLGASIGLSKTVYINTASGLINVSACSENMFGLVNQLMTQLGDGSKAGGFGYDLQLLPYCPITFDVDETASSITLDTSGLPTGAITSYTIIKNQNNAVRGIIFYPDKCNFTKNINFVKNLDTVDKTIILTDEDSYEFKAVWDGEQIDHITNVDDPIVLDVEINEADIVRLIADINHNADVHVSYYLKSKTELVLETDNSWLPAGATTVNLDVSVEIRLESVHKPTALELKISNETDFVRLTGPNFNSMFEFKLSKLEDGINYVNTDCTYKPFAPYVKLNPNFTYLYGQDFNDATGLKLQGDFSLPILSDAWVNYELNNRTYQQIFNRGIENLDVAQNIEMQKQTTFGQIGIATGAVGAAAQGMKYGGSIAGGWGAAAGAALGAAGGTLLGYGGYMLDKNWLEQAQAETRQYEIDKFRLTNAAVQALPQSMTKATPLSYNNKVWPIFEEFSCTDKEKDLLRLKLTYDGMTINAIGSLKDYAVNGGWVKGRLIRQYNMEDDFHVADELYKEVNKGFYLGD